MPDDDRLPRSLSGRWHRVFKALKAGEPQEAIEFHVARATAETLRRMHGVPGLHARGVQLHRAVTGSADQASPGNEGSPDLSPHISARLASKAVDVLAIAIKDRLALTSPDGATLALARRLVADVAYTFGLDRMAPVLMADGHSSRELHSRFESLVRSNPLGELAERLLAHPDGAGLRSPAQPRPKVATADLMDIDIRGLL